MLLSLFFFFFSLTWGQNNTQNSWVMCTRNTFTLVIQIDTYTTSQITIIQGGGTFQAKHKILDSGLLPMYWWYVGPRLPFYMMNSEKLSTCKALFETWYSNTNCFSYTWNTFWLWFTLKRIKIYNPNTDSQINHFAFKIADSSV